MLFDKFYAGVNYSSDIDLEAAKSELTLDKLEAELVLSIGQDGQLHPPKKDPSSAYQPEETYFNKGGKNQGGGGKGGGKGGNNQNQSKNGGKGAPTIKIENTNYQNKKPKSSQKRTKNKNSNKTRKIALLKMLPFPVEARLRGSMQ